nr:hypothetical protein Q903MT_gene3443 [Picea sitchensis]
MIPSYTTCKPTCLFFILNMRYLFLRRLNIQLALITELLDLDYLIPNVMQLAPGSSC